MFKAFFFFTDVKVKEKVNISVVLFPINHDGSGSSGVSKFIKKRHLICNSNKCEPLNVLHFGYIAYSKMNLEVSFSPFKNLTVSQISFEVSFYLLKIYIKEKNYIIHIQFICIKIENKQYFQKQLANNISLIK